VRGETLGQGVKGRVGGDVLGRGHRLSRDVFPAIIRVKSGVLQVGQPDCELGMGKSEKDAQDTL
jgi:hypothetical protein